MRYLRSQRVWFFSRFGHTLGTDFGPFGHKLGMVFHSSLELGIFFFRRNYFFIIIDDTINNSPSVTMPQNQSEPR